MSPAEAMMGIGTVAVTEDAAQPQDTGRDSAWVERAYHEHHRFVWRVLARLGVPEPLLEDALQEVYVVLHRRRHEFDGRSTVRTWLHGIASRVGARARDRWRREPPQLPCSVGPSNPEAAAADRQALARLERALRAVAPERREIFVLCEVEGMSGDEIATLFGINRNTAYSRMRLARRDVARALEREPIEEVDDG